MGCRVCRARKVKCDGRPNGCRNCERLQLDCVGEDGVASAKFSTVSATSSNAATPKKIRTYRSCTNCRLSKTKCNGNRPKCSRCSDKTLDCIYDGGAAPRWTKSLKRSANKMMQDSNETAHVNGDDDGRSEQSGLSTMDMDMDMDMATPPPSEGRTTVKSPQGGDSNASESGGADDRNGDEAFHKISQQGGANSGAYSWLLSPTLPSGRNLRRVVEQYFANIHPLRCFAFVHKPSFMRQLDKGSSVDDEAALLHIVCAHGAKFLVMSLNGEQPPDTDLLSAAGNQWAKRAEYLLLANFGKITVQRLMTAILLHEFHFRAGEYTQSLMISGLAVRMAHALKINTEYNIDILCSETKGDDSAPSVVSRESRRRLMWACYILDAWSGSGTDQLTLLQENDIKIQLPCNERNFGLRIPTVTETLGMGHVLQFLPPAVVPRKPAANMGIMAYYIRIVTLWKKIVRYVNRLDSSTRPWLPESDFAALDSDLRLWRRELPDFVEYTTETIYARLDSNQLGALVLIHCTYHHNYLELYKLSMPDLFKLSKPLAIPTEHVEFFQSAQDNCYFHAHQIADILAEAAEHGAKLLSDSLLPYFVYDSSRVMLYYVARLLDPSRLDAQDKVRDAIRAVESNNRVLRLMSALFPIAKSLSTTIERWLSKIKQASNREDLVKKLATEREPDIPGVEIPNSNSDSSSAANPDISLPSISLQSLTRNSVNNRRSTERATTVASNNRSNAMWANDGANATLSSPVAATPTAQPLSWSRPNSISNNTALSNGNNMSSPSPNGNQFSSAGLSFMGIGGGLDPKANVPVVRSGLQHERPVAPQQQPRRPLFQQQSSNPMMCEALDLDDLQNFLSWDMYGIRDMGDPVSDEVGEDLAAHSWAGAI